MITLLAKWLIPNRENTADAVVRRAYGQLCGFVGIALNVLLFAGKFFAGTLSGSIAITADAFNNLSDAGSSVVTLLGFRLAGRKPDPEHPFGHGRMEYLSGLVVSALIPWNIAGSVPLQMLDAGSGAIPYMVLLYMIPLCYGLSKKWLTRGLFSRKGEEV